MSPVSPLPEGFEAALLDVSFNPILFYPDTELEEEVDFIGVRWGGASLPGVQEHIGFENSAGFVDSWQTHGSSGWFYAPLGRGPYRLYYDGVKIWEVS